MIEKEREKVERSDEKIRSFQATRLLIVSPEVNMSQSLNLFDTDCRHSLLDQDEKV